MRGLHLGLGLGRRRSIPAQALNALALSASSITERSPENVLVGLVQGDTEGSTITIPTGMDAGGRFKYSEGQVLTGATATDYETATSHAVTLRETLDGYTNSPRDTVLTITVADIADETAPTITSSATVSVAEGTALAHGVTADEPLSRIEIVGGADAALFYVDGLTLRMAARDFEAPSDADANNTHLVSIRAFDTAGNASATQAITVTVTDVAESAPLGPPQTYAGTSVKGSGGSTYTFTGVGLGAAAADRLIVLGIGVARKRTPARTVTGVTIGGAAATIIRQATNTGGGNGMTLCLAALIVALGTTADLVVTLDGVADACDLMVYRVTGQDSATPFDHEAHAPATGVATTALDVPANGLGVAFALGNGGTLGGMTWTGLAEDYDAAVTSGGVARQLSAASTTGLAAETGRTVSATASTTAEIVVSASWGKAVGATDPHFSSVTLLAGFDGADGATTYTEESSLALPATFAAPAQLDTAVSKFGTGSLLTDNTANVVVSFPNRAEHDVGAGDFTIEGWVRWNVNPSGGGTRHFWLRGDGTNWDYYMAYNDVSKCPTFSYIDTAGNLHSVSGGANSWTPVANTWYYVAVSRASNVFYVFVDGVLLAQYTHAITIRNVAGSTVRLGREAHHTDEFRLTKGVGRYTASFTPPTEPFPRS